MLFVVCCLVAVVGVCCLVVVVGVCCSVVVVGGVVGR